MVKSDEMNDPGSCLSRARDDERIFVLLARDPAAPAAIRAWIQERCRLGLNHWSDPKLRDAEGCASMMDRERRERETREGAR